MDDTQDPSTNTQGPNNNQVPNPNDQTVQAATDDLAQLTSQPTESFKDITEDFEEKQTDFQAMYDAGGSFKKGMDEIAEAFEGLAPQTPTVHGKGGVETEPSYAEASAGKPVEAVTEIPTEPEIEKKAEGFIERVEKAGEVQQFVVDDYTKEVLLEPTNNQNAKVTLPLSADQVEKGLHMQVWDSIRWLAEWCRRQIKMLKDRVAYKSN